MENLRTDRRASALINLGFPAWHTPANSRLASLKWLESADFQLRQAASKSSSVKKIICNMGAEFRGVEASLSVPAVAPGTTLHMSALKGKVTSV